LLQATRSLRVISHSGGIGVLPSIELNNEIRIKADEIDDVASDRVLSAEAKLR
jgi:hypothetical protein